MLPVRTPVTDTVAQYVADADPLAVVATLDVADTEGERELVALMVKVTEVVPESDGVSDVVTHRELEWVADCVWDEVVLPVSVRVDPTLREALADAVPVRVIEGDAEFVNVAEGEPDTVTERVTAASVGDAEPVTERDCSELREDDGEVDTDELRDGDAVDEGVMLGEVEIELLADSEVVWDGLRVGETVCDCVAVTLTERDAEPVREGVVEVLGDGVGDTDGTLERDELDVEDTDTHVEDVREAEADPVGERVERAVAEGLLEADTDGVVVKDTVGEPVKEGESELEAVALLLRLADWQCVGDTVCERVTDVVGHVDVVRDVETDPETVTLADDTTDTVELTVGVDDTLRVTVLESVTDCVRLEVRDTLLVGLRPELMLLVMLVDAEGHTVDDMEKVGLPLETVENV